MISEYTENQLVKGGVWDMWETTKKIPSLKNKEELDEIYIQQPDFELIEGMEWLNFKGNKVSDITPWECKRSIVMGKPCVTIQEVDHDRILGAKVITNDIDLIIWLEDFKKSPKMRVVNIDKKDVYDINNLEKHGVRFNSTIDKEELDENGVMITGIDNYDNYFYEIYDSMRNTYKHEKNIVNVEKIDEIGEFIEKWLDEHQIKNDYDDIIDFWCEDFYYDVKWNHSFQFTSLYDRETYGGKLYEGGMKQLCEKYDIPMTIGWDIWKIITIDKMNHVLKQLKKTEERTGL